MKKLISWLIITTLLLCTGCSLNEIKNGEETNQSKDTDNYTVGSTFESDGVSVTLNSATYPKEDAFDTPPAGDEYILINFSVNNNTDENYNMGEIGFDTFVDGSHTDTLKITPSYIQTTTLLPDTSAMGDLDYQIPENWKEIKVHVKIGAVDGKEAVFTITPSDVILTH